MRCALLDLVAEPEPHPSSLASEQIMKSTKVQTLGGDVRAR